MFYLMHTKYSYESLVFCNQSSHITKVRINEGLLWLIQLLILFVRSYCNVRRGMCTMKIFGRTEALG